MTVPYAEFLAAKRRAAGRSGRDIAPGDVHPMLHDWQARIVTWAVGVGRAAIWADTGLGKSVMQLEWARLSGDRVLVIAPLAVCQQTVREAAKIGVQAAYVRGDDDADGPGIWVTNYEMAGRFDPARLDAVVLDEASILKQSDGKTRTALIEQFAAVPRRLACTATPAPNDVEELTNQAEFLGVMRRAEMLAAYFVHDDQGWRLKGHARGPMFAWMTSWAVAVRTPSDIGGDDTGYILPGLEIVGHRIAVDAVPDGQLFATDLGGVGGRARIRKQTMSGRVARAVEVVNDCGVAAAVPATVVRGQPGSGSGVPGEDEGREEPQAAGEVRQRPELPREGESGSTEARSSRAKQGAPGATGQELRPGPIGAGDDARSGMRDLPREPGGGSEGQAPRGPRSQDGHGPRCSLPVLQPGPGPHSGRPDSSDGAVLLPHACRDQWLVWCGLNAEQDALEDAFGDDCISIRGATPLDEKVRLEREWREGRARILVTKPNVYMFGMNWQHCARMVFVGISDSYEQYYQAIRRCYRYGQTRPVHAHIVVSELEGQIAANVARKERDANTTTESLIAAMRRDADHWSTTS